MKPTLVLLPGLDGTGELLAPLRGALDPAHTVAVLPYPDAPHDYGELEEQVRAQLPPQAPFILLGESFSGPIVLRIATAAPANLRGYVLCCSFVRAPRPLLCRAWPVLGVRWPMAVRRSVVRHLLLEPFGTAAIEQRVQLALSAVSARTLASRARAIAGVDLRGHLAAVGVPGLYLRASADRLVPRGCAVEFLRHTAHARVVDVEGPHALLLCNPAAAARVLSEFVAELE